MKYVFYRKLWFQTWNCLSRLIYFDYCCQMACWSKFPMIICNRILWKIKISCTPINESEISLKKTLPFNYSDWRIDNRKHDWGRPTTSFRFLDLCNTTSFEKVRKNAIKRKNWSQCLRRREKFRGKGLFGQIWVSVMLPFCHFEISVMLQFSKIFGQPPP